MMLKMLLPTASFVVAFVQLGENAALAQATGCTIGLSRVACPSASRTVVVAQTGAAHYRHIQEALDAAVPGDTVLVRSGTYSEPITLRVSGTSSAPVTLRAYAGERPILKPQIDGQTAYVSLSGSWLVLDGFEITGGRHGVVVTGAHNILRNSYVHENGQGCLATDVCGQGVIIASTTDVVAENNVIERNGLGSSSPWHVHGIYLSNYYGREVSNVSVLGNVIREHGGAGLQVWDDATTMQHLLVQGNRFEDNVVEAILTNVRDGLVRGNEFVHNGHPVTDARQSAMLWLEFSRNVVFEGNTFHYTGAVAHGVPTVPIHAYSSDQNAQDLRWSGNTWDAPGYGLTDAQLNARNQGPAPPSPPTLVADRVLANPVSVSWVAGAGAEPDEYILVTGTAPGAADVSVVPVGRQTVSAKVVPVGLPLFVRVVARNARGSATSNEVVFTVSSNTLADLAIDFGPGLGLWSYSDGGGGSTVWQPLHSFSPSLLTRGDLDGNGRDDLVVSFAGQGLWARFDSGAWVQLSVTSVTALAVGNIDGSPGGKADAIVHFAGQGVWAYVNNATWTRLHAFTALDLQLGDLDGNGVSDLIVQFAGLGEWVLYNNSSWAQLHAFAATGITTGNIDGDAGGKADVVLDFPGLGVWAFLNNTTWMQLHAFDASLIATGDLDGNGKSELVLHFPGLGIWVLKNLTTWTQIHSFTAEALVSGR